MTTTYRITRYREEIVHLVAAWLHAHGIEARDVPLTGPITIHDGKITVTRYLRGDNGQFQRNGDDIATETLTVDQIAPWPHPEGTQL